MARFDTGPGCGEKSLARASIGWCFFAYVWSSIERVRRMCVLRFISCSYSTVETLYVNFEISTEKMCNLINCLLSNYLHGES